MVDLVNELNGKVAIVSGSSRNIGRATAIELAKGGASLVINARKSVNLCDEVVAEIGKLGGKAIAVVADISDANSVKKLVAKTVAKFGKVDILVNNAAVRSNIPFLEIDQTEWVRIAGTCLQGTLNLSRACIPHMIKEGGGAIVSLAGLSSYKGSPGRPHVMATKDGLISVDDRIIPINALSGIMYNKIVKDPKITVSLKSDEKPNSLFASTVSKPLS